MRLTVEKTVFLLYYVIKISEKEGMGMAQNRVRIVDVADALGLSTATVSKVIHGKTGKISDETVKPCPAGARKVRIYPQYGRNIACKK